MLKLYLISLHLGLACFCMLGISLGKREPSRKNNPNDSLPPPSDKILFHISRSNNNNFIVYELNTDKQGAPVKTQPVHPYWIRNTEGGSKAELSFVQQKFAYGLQHQALDKEGLLYKIHFVSYQKKPLLLAKSPKDKQYRVYFHWGKRSIVLRKVYVKLDGGTFWFPHIPYIEITGIDELSGEIVKERFKP